MFCFFTSVTHFLHTDTARHFCLQVFFVFCTDFCLCLDRTCPAACGSSSTACPVSSTWSCSSSALWPTMGRLVFPDTLSGFWHEPSATCTDVEFFFVSSGSSLIRSVWVGQTPDNTAIQETVMNILTMKRCDAFKDSRWQMWVMLVQLTEIGRLGLSASQSVTEFSCEIYSTVFIYILHINNIKH